MFVQKRQSHHRVPFFRRERRREKERKPEIRRERERSFVPNDSTAYHTVYTYIHVRRSAVRKRRASSVMANFARCAVKLLHALSLSLASRLFSSSSPLSLSLSLSCLYRVYTNVILPKINSSIFAIALDYNSKSIFWEIDVKMHVLSLIAHNRLNYV